ncbi:MAG: hypothetical protein JXR37_22165 [Kiritimatiellae bacterium]|nr:hypothetical protein [Kiritimatiellia bacterium]
MGFESGALGFRIFYVPDGVPDDFIKRFARHAAPPIEKLGVDPIHGWVTGRHLLDRQIEEDTAMVAGYLRVTLMKAERKIPESLLHAECRMAELAELEARGAATLDRAARLEIKRSVMERLFPTMPPTLTGIPLAWLPDSDALYAGAMSDKQVDALQIAWQKTLGTPLIALSPATAAIKRKQVDVRDLRPTSLSPECEDDTMGDALGEDFLTWLWFFAEARGGLLKVGDAGQYAVMVEGPLVFFREAEGAHVTLLRQGMPLVSTEAKTALLSGKKLKCARVCFALGDATWSVTLDADEFVFRGYKPPKAPPVDPVSRFQQRMISLKLFTEAFLGFFDRFLDERVDPGRWRKTRGEIHAWVSGRKTRR